MSMLLIVVKKKLDLEGVYRPNFLLSLHSFTLRLLISALIKGIRHDSSIMKGSAQILQVRRL